VYKKNDNLKKYDSDVLVFGDEIYCEISFQRVYE
jgi:hypothetical protein